MNLLTLRRWCCRLFDHQVLWDDYVRYAVARGACEIRCRRCGALVARAMARRP